MDVTAVTHVGTSLGTPAYMSPEQATADPNIDARTDLYAWGLMAYETHDGEFFDPLVHTGLHIGEAQDLVRSDVTLDLIKGRKGKTPKARRMAAGFARPR